MCPAIAVTVESEISGSETLAVQFNDGAPVFTGRLYERRYYLTAAEALQQLGCKL